MKKRSIKASQKYEIQNNSRPSTVDIDPGYYKQYSLQNYPDKPGGELKEGQADLSQGIMHSIELPMEKESEKRNEEGKEEEELSIPSMK